MPLSNCLAMFSVVFILKERLSTLTPSENVSVNILHCGRRTEGDRVTQRVRFVKKTVGEGSSAEGARIEAPKAPREVGVWEGV